METVLVALLVGAVSGLGGAVLGPALGHRFNRAARKDVRRERRQEHLRSMIELRIGDWRRYNAAVFSIHYDVTHFGMTGTQAFGAFNEKERENNPGGGNVWEEYRIGDAELKTDAEALNVGLQDLMILLAKVIATKSIESIEDWHKECESKADELDDLKKKMQLRMDELDW